MNDKNINEQFMTDLNSRFNNETATTKIPILNNLESENNSDKDIIANQNPTNNNMQESINNNIFEQVDLNNLDGTSGDTVMSNNNLGLNVATDNNNQNNFIINNNVKEKTNQNLLNSNTQSQQHENINFDNNSMKQDVVDSVTNVETTNNKPATFFNQEIEKPQDSNKEEKTKNKSVKIKRFNYKVKDSSGEIITSYFDAEKEVDVQAFLLSKNYEIISITEDKLSTVLGLPAMASTAKMNSKDLRQIQRWFARTFITEYF